MGEHKGDAQKTIEHYERLIEVARREGYAGGYREGRSSRKEDYERGYREGQLSLLDFVVPAALHDPGMLQLRKQSRGRRWTDHKADQILTAK